MVAAWICVEFYFSFSAPFSAAGIPNYHNGLLPMASHKGQGQEIMEECKGILTSLNQSLVIGSRDWWSVVGSWSWKTPGTTPHSYWSTWLLLIRTSQVTDILRKPKYLRLKDLSWRKVHFFCFPAFLLWLFERAPWCCDGTPARRKCKKLQKKEKSGVSWRTDWEIGVNPLEWFPVQICVVFANVFS